MAEFIGQLLSSIPSWLIVPATIVVIILTISAWWIWIWAESFPFGGNLWPLKPKRAYLGEKKNDKK